MKTLTNPKVIIALLGLVLMSCGAHKEEAGLLEESSRLTGSPGTTANKQVSLCNQATDATQTLRINLSAHLDYNNRIEPNFIHLKVTNIPSNFATSEEYISLWKWYAETNGYSYVAPSPLTFRIVKIQTGEELTGNMTKLSWSSVSEIASAIGATNPAQFFHKVRLFVQLNDPNALYDVLTLSLHHKTAGTASLRVDALIPAFYSDPRQYAVDRAAVLNQLHPFASANYTQWSTNTFAVKSNEMCAPLLQY